MRINLRIVVYYNAIFILDDCKFIDSCCDILSLCDKDF